MNAGVLVIGGGIAGSAAALGLADRGISVVMLTASKSPDETASFHAQGGIVYKGRGDSPRMFAEDIWTAGARRGDQSMIRLIADNGPESVEQMLFKRLKVGFDRTSDGSLSLTREAAHSCPRIIHCRDATGSAIMKSLYAETAAHPNISILSGYSAIELLVAGGGCIGAEAVSSEGRLFNIYASATILATGGAGQLFERTSNPSGACGQGVAIAVRAGAELKDMEYFQFHPTALAVDGAEPFLISEAVRGAGARLVTADNTPFMDKYDPQWSDLAPRDVVSRAICTEMENLRQSNVYLNFFDYLPKHCIIDRFPTIYNRCKNYGIDITRELLPVAPAAHFLCGGIAVDSWAETNLNGLYALGECSCTGIHGANRLASTSLLEGVFWADRAARKITSDIRPAAGGQQITSAVGRTSVGNYDRRQLHRIRSMKDQIRTIMWEKAGIIRRTDKLREAVEELNALNEAADRIYFQGSPTAETSGLRNMATAAVHIAGAALRNRVSRGSHFIVS